jgi:hypothetical protein
VAPTLSLIEAQRTYTELGAMEFRFTGLVRMAGASEPIDDGWRPIDLALDDFEPRGITKAPWPRDLTTLYWWRPTFWRRGRGSATPQPPR